MKAALFAAALATAHLTGLAAVKADWSDEVRATYLDFAAAQNARDLQKVRALLLDSPQFLWVSDGRSVWGRDATVARMASFQGAEVWRVEPSLAEAVPVQVGEGTALPAPAVAAGDRVGRKARRSRVPRQRALRPHS